MAEETFRIRRNNVLRQAIQADPTLIEKAAEHVKTYHPRRRLEEYDTATDEEFEHSRPPSDKVCLYSETCADD